MKRIIAILLTVFLCAGLLSAVAQASPGTNYTLTGNQLEDMVAVANAQEGKHASDFGFNSEWCAYFVAWCGKIAAPGMFPSSWSSLGTPKHVAVYLCNNSNGALYYFSNSVTNSLNLNNITWDPNWNTGNYVQTSQSSFTPQRGDLICFNWAADPSFSWDHIGIVTAVNGSTVYYTDGNTGSGSSYTTRTVIVGHSISRSSSEIIGYIRPNYSGTQPATYRLDVNGYLDSLEDEGNIRGYGTVDVYVNGSLVADDVGDYCAEWPYGTTYEITDIKVADGKMYLGVVQGELSGTIVDTTKVKLHFSTPNSGGNRVIPDGKYRIISALDSRYAVGIPSYSATDGDNVQLYPWSDGDSTSTVFDIQHFENGYYIIRNSYDNSFSLNCAARGTVPGTNVISWSYHPSNTQAWAHWVFFPTGNGTYNIIARHCGLFLEVSGGAAAGSNLQLNIGYGAATEQFYLEPVLINSITVSFDANGGKVSPSSQSVTWNSTYGTLPKPTRSGYRFGGWYTKASGGTLVKADSSVSITYDHTLYAHWTKIESQSEENVTGWQKEDGKWYYYNADGERLTGWQKISGKWYYFGKDGAMTKGWQKISGKWYYLGTNGVMTKGWQKISNKWYYLGTNGVMATGWQQISGKWYYLGTGGVMTTGWQKISNKWYYMDGSGVMQTGWLKSGTKWYYLGTNGVMTTGWQQVSGKWYYMDGSGVMQTGWLKSGTKWYYLGKDGAMTTGWQQVSGKWYYLGTDGVMQTGWQKLSKKWYYFDPNGVMLTGWQKISGDWYYFNESGAMVTGTQTINGKTYTFSNSGVWAG